VLPEKMTSLAILVALREWTTQNEWTGKAARAEKAGVKPETIAALAEGRRPESMAEDEATIYDFCTELMRNHSVSDPTYARMIAKFGEEGVMEAVNIEGFYTLISMALNTARLTPANGAKPLMPLPH
jgi:4-carboxymuconolactone decarboxylase